MFNKVIFAGNLTRDPEVRYTPKGTAVCDFAVASNRKWTTEAGEAKEEATFVDFTAFGRTAENIGQYFKKGNPILLEGELRLEQWEDKNGGGKRSRLKVLVSKFCFMSKGDGAGAGGNGRKIQDGDVPPREAPVTARQRVIAAGRGTAPASADSDDNIPF
jgi:single-strand DNA-binding protein